MTPNLRVDREVTKTAIFRRDSFRGTLLQEPGKRPQIFVDKVHNGLAVKCLIKEVLDVEEIEVLASILNGMISELTPVEEEKA